MPDNNSILNKRLTNDAGGPLYHRIAGTGTVVMYCPIPVNIATPSAPTAMEPIFADKSNSGSIKFEYMGLNKNNGSSSVFATFTSSGTSGSPTYQIGSPVAISGTYDTSNWVYFVRVTMSRTVADNDLIFYGVTIF